MEWNTRWAAGARGREWSCEELKGSRKGTKGRERTSWLLPHCSGYRNDALPRILLWLVFHWFMFTGETSVMQSRCSSYDVRVNFVLQRYTGIVIAWRIDYRRKLPFSASSFTPTARTSNMNFRFFSSLPKYDVYVLTVHRC